MPQENHFNNSNIASPLSHTSSKGRKSTSQALSLSFLGKANQPQKQKPSLSTFQKIKLQRGRSFFFGRPVIHPSKYGTDGPVFDIFALFQNAIKKQILDGYSMLESMLRYKYEVTQAERELFLEWLDSFEITTFKIIEVEESVLYPYLEESHIVPSEVFSGFEREKLILIIKERRTEFYDGYEKTRWLPAGESLPRLAETMGIFFISILQYFKAQAQAVWTIQKSNQLTGAKIRVLRGRIIDVLREQDNFPFLIVFVSNWLTESQLRTWKRVYLSTIDSMRYEQWRRRYTTGHGSIPQKLHKQLHKASTKVEGKNRISENLSVKNYDSDEIL